MQNYYRISEEDLLDLVTCGNFKNFEQGTADSIVKKIRGHYLKCTCSPDTQKTTEQDTKHED